MDNELIDDETLINTLLTRDAPEGAEVAADLDVDSIDYLPFVTFSVLGNGQDGNGRGLWSSTLIVNVFGDGSNEAFGVAKTLYRKIHGWAMPGIAVIPGVGSVEGVEDISKFSRTGSVVMNGKHVNQYVGSFGLTLRNQ